MIFKRIGKFIKDNTIMNDEVKEIYNEITENNRINLLSDRGIQCSWNNEKNCLILNWEHLTFRSDELKIYYLCGNYHIIFYKDNEIRKEISNLRLNEIKKIINEYMVIKLI